MHEEQQTGLQVYSRVRERGWGHEINKMSGNLQQRHRGREKGLRRKSFASTGCFCWVFILNIHRLPRWTSHMLIY